LAFILNYQAFTVVRPQTRHVVGITKNSLKHYSLGIDDILANILIDTSQIGSVEMRFRIYSSTRPYPSVTAELWVDAVNLVPLPPAILMLGSSLFVLVFLIRRKRNGTQTRLYNPHIYWYHAMNLSTT
jgi:hypothetical protein